MRATVSRWGNSAAVRLPARLLAEAGLGAGDAVELRLEDGRIVIAPVPAPGPVPDLDALIAAITPETLHAEADFGPAAGREAW